MLVTRNLPVVSIWRRPQRRLPDVQVRRALRTFENSKMEWHTRTGSPHCLTDLESAAAGQASTIILLRPEDEKVNPLTVRSHGLLVSHSSAGGSRVRSSQQGSVPGGSRRECGPFVASEIGR